MADHESAEKRTAEQWCEQYGVDIAESTTRVADWHLLSRDASNSKED